MVRDRLPLTDLPFRLRPFVTGVLPQRQSRPAAGGWNLKRLHDSDTEIPVLVREEGFEPPTASV